MKQALTIAGWDPSGGAGLLADLKTFAALSVYGLGVATAITVQDSSGVKEWAPVRPQRLVRAQLEALLADFPVSAVKTGLLGGSGVVEAVAEALAVRRLPLVVDPVLASSSGTSFTDARALTTVRKRLLPLATLVTPNLPEAEALSGRSVRPDRRESWAEAARAIADGGARAVLVKGGHAGGDISVDLLWDGKELREISGPRIEGRPLHGTGCTLSAAITAGLARGGELPESIRQARRFLEGALASSRSLGKGPRGPMHHLYPFYPWEERAE